MTAKSPPRGRRSCYGRVQIAALSLSNALLTAFLPLTHSLSCAR